MTCLWICWAAPSCVYVTLTPFCYKDHGHCLLSQLFMVYLVALNTHTTFVAGSSPPKLQCPLVLQNYQTSLDTHSAPTQVFFLMLLV